MDTTKKNQSLLFAILAIALMIGSGYLLSWTINVLYVESTAYITLPLSLLAVFIYAAGATLMGKVPRKEIVRHSHDGINNGIQLAFVLIACGALLLCFNMGILSLEWKSFFFSWPMLVFAIGAFCICQFQFIAGLIAMAAGIFFLIGKTSVMYPNIQVEQLMSNFWPAIFIVAGIVIIMSFLVRPKVFRYGVCCKGSGKDNFKHIESENNNGKINYKLVFSASEQVILDPVFKGGTIEAVFGGLELDLRRTTLDEGKTTLNVKAVFGGVELAVPDSWEIELVSKSFAGGVSDSRLKSRDIDHSRKLVIIAECVFGGIELR